MTRAKTRRAKCACGEPAAYVCCFPLGNDGTEHLICTAPVCVAHSRTEPGAHWCARDENEQSGGMFELVQLDGQVGGRQ